ncbi:hypothetical protein [Faecalibacter rhinopitheci]|uniref:Uncharacterized protein n=1 Tax=Faecalibacter rhinopitheci TaxID=2779678 RepID=A0A8J7FKS1_9FLAO|nr:hypothetical protein [Faecalibacter rhinopitheci]MBF0595920.1 hypothetical protein [Faecalibacter rhinopitheci]
MKQFLSFFTVILLSTVLYSQISNKPSHKNKQTFYFFTIYYGFKNDVYVSEIYSIDINREELFKNTEFRYEEIKQYLVNNKIVNEIQSGYEKNYFQLNQAENERKVIMSQLTNHNYDVRSFQYIQESQQLL